MRQAIRFNKSNVSRKCRCHIKTDDYKITPPPRTLMKNSMKQSLCILNIITEDFLFNTGEIYTAVEAP